MARKDPDPNLDNILPRVHLVGAGPGDPGLLTRKGAHLLANADVVLYDHLVPLELLDLAPVKALRIDVGKVRNHPRMTQAEIESTMIDHAKLGRRVVRLKGGDPFVFGRGGEEAQALQKAGIPFSIVPGVSSTVAVPAYAGVPVTHRDHNSRFVILTAHNNPSGWSDQELAALCLPNQTIVVLMGVLYMKQLACRLLASGLSPDTPALLVRWGTTASQECVDSPLGQLENLINRTPLSPPVILLIGGVVKLRSEIDWVHRLPLFGKRILLTREPERSLELGSILETLGATVISCPTISVHPSLTQNAEDRFKNLHQYSWIVFLSPNGVRHFFRELSKKRIDLRTLAGIRIFSMGQATTDALESNGIIPDASPQQSHGPGVIETFRTLRASKDENILLIRGDRGTGLIPEGLKEMGFSVDTVGVYENVLPEIPTYKRERLESLLDAEAIDLAIYYSPSSFTGLCELFPDRLSLIGKIPGLSIGPTTRTALEEGAMATIIHSRTPTQAGILEATLDFLSPLRNNSGVLEPSNPGKDSSEEPSLTHKEPVTP